MQSGGEVSDSQDSTSLRGNKTVKVAVVAMQGDFAKHIASFERIGVTAYPARLPEDIDNADAVVLPGGESTTIGKLLTRYGVDNAIRRAADRVFDAVTR